VLNQQEREMISRRTKEALAAAKARGVKLGGTGGAHNALAENNRMRKVKSQEHIDRVAPIVTTLRNQGHTMRSIVAVLNAGGITAPKGGKWGVGQVQRLIASIRKG
jgi:DNA invertase Pin-like site-specific DNA recombinase